MLRQGQPAAALPLIEQGLGQAASLGRPHLTGRMLTARFYARYIAGDPVDAVHDAVEALRLFREAGDRLQAGATLGNLGYIELSAGDLDAARSHLAEALDTIRALGDRDGIVYATLNLGLAEYLGGSPGAAEALFAESLDLAGRLGMKRQIAYPLIGLAMVGHGGADHGWSARLHGAADQILSDLDETMEPLEARLAGEDRERLRAALGTGAFEAEYAAGHALDLTHVAREVLHEIRAVRTGQRAAAAPEKDTEAPGSGEAVTLLTARELDVLRLVAQGLSNHDIAKRLVVSEHTVHRHLANILHKLSLSSRAAAAAWGVRAGLV
jgi:ATP/maltotriose-dependent transcriptional regulator MalT